MKRKTQISPVPPIRKPAEPGPRPPRKPQPKPKPKLGMVSEGDYALAGLMKCLPKPKLTKTQKKLELEIFLKRLRG